MVINANNPNTPINEFKYVGETPSCVFDNSFHKSYQQIENEMDEAFDKSMTKFKYTNREVNPPAFTATVKPKIDDSPEAIALHLVAHIEKLNKQLRKTQDRLGKVRASNRRLKAERDEALSADNERFQDVYDDMKSDRDWYRDAEAKAMDKVLSFKLIACNLYYRSSK